MARVQDVEATVGKDDLVAPGARGGNSGNEGVAFNHTVFDGWLPRNGSVDFLGARGCSANPFANQSGGEIGHVGAFDHTPAKARGDAEPGRDSVARARYVINLDVACLYAMDGPVPLDDSKPIAA